MHETKMNKDYLGLDEVKGEFPIIPRITKGAWKKAECYGNLPVEIYKLPLESKRFLFVRPDDPHLIRDVYYPQQIVTLDDVLVEAYEVFESIRAMNPDLNRLRGWEHIHPYIFTNPSYIDKDNNKKILTQIPLDVRLTENKLSKGTALDGTVAEVNIEHYTTYMVSIIHNPTAPNPSLIERFAERIAGVAVKMPGLVGALRLEDEEMQEDFTEEPYVEIAFRRWTESFVPQEYICERWKLDIVEVDDDIPYEPDKWRAEVMARTTIPDWAQR